MKKLNIFLVVVATLLMVQVGFARETMYRFSIKNAVTSSLARRANIGTGVSFYFGKQKYGEVLETISTISTNRKTNAFGKSDKAACTWAFLSALKNLRAYAIKHGGNAVVNIKSNYKNHLVSSEKTYVCGAGALVAGVALQGTVVKLAY